MTEVQYRPHPQNSDYRIGSDSTVWSKKVRNWEKVPDSIANMPTDGEWTQIKKNRQGWVRLRINIRKRTVSVKKLFALVWPELVPVKEKVKKPSRIKKPKPEKPKVELTDSQISQIDTMCLAGIPEYRIVKLIGLKHQDIQPHLVSQLPMCLDFIPIPGYERYWLTLDGRVWYTNPPRYSHPTEVEQVISKHGDGRPEVTMYNGAHNKIVSVPLLVMYLSGQYKESGGNIIHIDGNVWNCSPENLRYENEETA